MRRFFHRPKTVYQCTALFTFVQFLTCCNGLWYYRGRYITNKWTQLYSIGAAVNSVTTQWSMLYLLLTDPRESARIYAMDKLLLWICALELLMSTCSFVLIVRHMQRNASRHVQLYDRINALDERLMREYGANLNYYKLLRKNIVEVSILALGYVTAVSCTVSHMAPQRFCVTAIATFYYMVSTSGPHFTCYLHMNFTEMLRIRFRLLQKLLDPAYLRVKFPAMALREQRLLGLVDIVREFHLIIGQVNVVYRSSLMVALLHDFTLATTVLYLLFGHSIDGSISYQMLAYGAVWLLQPLYKFVTMPISCDRAINEGKRCLRLIEQVDIWFPHCKRAKTLVSAMMYWRLENKIEFACGLNVTYNRAIIATMTAVIFNYLLILIQFRMTQLMGEQIEEQKNILQDWIGDI